jgi:hypothetical protein
VTVRWTRDQRLENQEIESALKHLAAKRMGIARWHAPKDDRPEQKFREKVARDSEI